MSILCDGRQFAFTYQAVQIASGEEKDRPALYRTMLVDVFPGGVRLVAVDGYLLLVGWVERADTITDTDRVDDGELADESFVVKDPHLRLLGLLKHIYSVTKGQDEGDTNPISLRIRTGGDIVGRAQQALDGMEPDRLTFEIPDVEAVTLEVADTPFPNWRLPHTPEHTAEFGVGVAGILRLGKLAKLHEGAHVRMTFGGTDGAALVQLEAPGTFAPFDIRGLVMPVRLSDEFRTEWGPVHVPADASDLDDEPLPDVVNGGDGWSVVSMDAVRAAKIAQREQAAGWVISSQIGSTALLVRKMKVSSGRASDLLEELELIGVVGSASESGHRAVLVSALELANGVITDWRTPEERTTPSDTFTGAVDDAFPGATVSVAGNVTTINVPMGDD
jgi:hypothetical protein